MIIYSIDPSIHSCGYAIHVAFNGNAHLCDYGLLKSSFRLDSDWQQSAIMVGAQMLLHIQKLQTYDADDMIVVLEEPEHWGSAKSSVAHAAAAIKKLAYFCGTVQGMALSHGMRVFLATAIDWKGSMPKKTIVNRVNTAYGLSFRNVQGDNDIAEAIAIGAWYCKRQGFTVQGLSESRYL
jgi:Holliday junction resolvasome RuvABC endonuclease subunit